MKRLKSQPKKIPAKEPSGKPLNPELIVRRAATHFLDQGFFVGHPSPMAIELTMFVEVSLQPGAKKLGIVFIPPHCYSEDAYISMLFVFAPNEAWLISSRDLGKAIKKCGIMGDDTMVIPLAKLRPFCRPMILPKPVSLWENEPVAESSAAPSEMKDAWRTFNEAHAGLSREVIKKKWIAAVETFTSLNGRQPLREEWSTMASNPAATKLSDIPF